ncbi:MAG: hypothetical protein ABDH91_00150 [Bacteroidia bacterium]
MPRWWLRYARLWIVALEARTELVLGRWAARILAVIFLGLALAFTLTLATLALIAVIAGFPRWSLAFGLAALIWMGFSWLLALFLPRWLYRRLMARQSLYRLRLAQAGMRLIEKTATPPPTEPSALLNLLPSLLPILWKKVIWPILRRWLPFR